MADAPDDDVAIFKQHMADALAAEAARNAPTPAVASPATAAPPPSTDPDVIQFKQHLADAQAAQDQQAAVVAAQPAPPPAPQTTVTGIAKNAAAGLTDAGANVLNLAANPSGTFGKALAVPIVAAHDFLAPYLGYQRFPDDVRHLLLDDQVPQPGTQAISALANAAGVDPNAVPANTTAERLVRKGVGAAGTMAVTGPNALTRGVVGAAGAVTGDTAAGLVPDWAKPVAEEAGNVVGTSAADLLGKSGQVVAGTSGGAATETAQLAQLARDKYGIPITAPQMSDSSFVRIANDQSKNLPFSGAAKSDAAIQGAWQKALIGLTGEDAPVATPEVMSNAASRIGGVFNDTAKRTNIDVDKTPLLGNLGDIETEAGSAPLGAGGHADIKALNDLIVKAAADGNGTISGSDYQALTRKGAPLDRGMSADDPNVAHYAGRIKEALDDAFQQSAAPEDQAALTTARSQWRAMKTIEDMVEKSPDGNLSPALLMGQVRNASSRFDGSTGGMAYTGGGDIADLARIGQKFMKPQPNSGTPDRLAVNMLVAGAGAGGGAGAVMGHPMGLVGVGGGLAANWLAGKYLRSAGLADRTIDSSLNGPRPLPNALAAGVLSNMEADRQRNALAAGAR